MLTSNEEVDWNNLKIGFIVFDTWLKTMKIYNNLNQNSLIRFK